MLLLGMLLLLGMFLAQVAASAPDNRGDVGFDYFYYVQQWPATYCNDHTCAHSPPRRPSFTVHGLWPQRRDGSWPEFCDSTPLHMQDIYDLIPDLERAWPSWAGPDEQFWYHEWSRHGTCATRVIRGGQHAFFQTALRLHQRLDILAALKSSGIRPSNNRHYPIQDLKDAIDEEFGVMPHITCDGQGQLAEVWMCLNKKLRPIDCVDGPHPHRALQAAGAAPSNYNCNSVKIPKLQRRLGEAAAEEEEADELTAAPAAVAAAVSLPGSPAAQGAGGAPAAAASQQARRETSAALNSAQASVATRPAYAAIAGRQELPAAGAAALLALVAVVAATAMVLQLVRRSTQDAEATATVPLLLGEA